MYHKPVRMAIIGGRRGAAFNKILQALSDKLQLVAFCDLDDEVVATWKSRYPDISTYNRYEDLLEDPNIDAVYIATPISFHASQSISALNAGKHVLCEVKAATTLEECWELVEAVEKSGLTYMMAENFIFTRPNMMVLNMANSGLFGEISFVEASYIHDVKHLMHDSEGQLTWRGAVRTQLNYNGYPTHSLGPVSHWLKINKPDGDEFESTVTVNSKEVANHVYFHEMFGESHPGADRNFWKQGDSSITLIKTKKGVLIQLRFDAQSFRPTQMMQYGLQGAKGAYLTGRFPEEEPIIWINGRSPGKSPHRPNDPKPVWEPLLNYAAEFEHPFWKKWGEIAATTGHNGGDFFVINEFCSAILEKRQPMIDIYDAVTWSSVSPLSIQSIKANGQSVPFINFRKNVQQKVISR